MNYENHEMDVILFDQNDLVMTFSTPGSGGSQMGTGTEVSDM